MAINLNLLRSFWVVGQAGSVSGAAQKNFISQPALSKAIRELERQVGVALLERGARGVKFTEPGRELFEHANAIFAIERAVEEALHARHTLEAGVLRIGGTTTISTYTLPPLLAQFRAAHPRLRLKITRANTSEIARLLLDYELDVALVEGPVHDARITARHWRKDELIAVCAPSHPLAGRKRITPRNLKSVEWIVREPGSGTREVVENALRDFDLPPRDALEIGGAEALKQAVAAGLGVAVVSKEAAADQIELGKLHVLPLRGVKMQRPFFLLRLLNRPLGPAARAFEQFLLQAEA
jgi:DNA-binding transcriptional LysR family regulator